MVLRLDKSLILRSLAVLILIGGVLGSWFAWQAVQENHASYLEKVISVEGDLIADAINSDLTAKFNALEFLSERYHTSPREALLGNIDDWSEFLTTGPGVLTVAITEHDGSLLWNFHKSTGVVLRDIIQRIDSSIISKERGQFVSLPGDGNLNGGHNFLVLWIPIYGESQQIRRLMIVLRPAPWVRDVLRARTNAFEDPMFELALSIDETTLFESPRYSTPNNREWIREFNIVNNNFDFALSVRPTDVLVDKFETLPEDLAAFLLFLLCVVTSVTLWLLGGADRKISAKQNSIDLLVQRQAEFKKELEIKQSEEKSRKWLLDHLLADTRMSLDNLMQIVPHLDKDQFPQNVRDHVRSAKNSTFYMLSLIGRIIELGLRDDKIHAGDEVDFDLEQLISGLVTLFRPLSERRNINIHYNIVGDSEQVYRGYAPVLRQFLFELFREMLSKREQGSLGALVSVNPQEEGYLLDVEITYQQDDQFIQTNRADSELKLNETLLVILDAEVTEFQTHPANLTLNFKIPLLSSVRKLPKVTLLGQDVEIPNLNILLVEDSDINQMIVREMLVKDGHQVSICDNGAQAVSVIRENPQKFDLVLMDIQMPVMNGIDATQAIREGGVTVEDLPIVAMTANTLKNQVDKYLEAGMQKILTKPIVHADVRNVIASIILDERNRNAGGGEELDGSSDAPLIDKDILEPITKLMTQAQLDILIKSLQETLNHNVPKLLDRKLTNEKRSRFAHEIKGMSSNAGLVSVADIASTIEVKMLSGEDCSADIKHLQRTFAKSIRVLNEYLQLEKQKNTGARTS
ncbi:MAG: response regulator [Sneathiella sp.]|nr:response regulator [Sneathiella sp.]